jgi:tripartite-type tricarboxylate transporter receptor subunit TctC
VSRQGSALPTGVGAPAGTPADVIGKLNKEINADLADAKIRAGLADVVGVPTPMTPARATSRHRHVVDHLLEGGDHVPQQR